METLQGELLVDGFRYGEGPRWHDGRLWFTDGPAGVVYSVDDDGRLEVMVETEHPSGLGWLPDGTLVISALQEAKLERVGPEGVTLMHDLSDRGWSTNDMVAGPRGHIYVDLYQRVENRAAIGGVLLVTPEGDVRVVADDFSTPNGLGITPDGTTLVMSETYGGLLHAFTILPDGSLTDQRVFAELGEGRHPDGLCLDAEGAVWVGCYDTAEFVRVREGGEITHRVVTDGGWTVAPALGGPDRRTLFMVVDDLADERQGLGDSKGRIETVRVDVPGAGWP